MCTHSGETWLVLYYRFFALLLIRRSSTIESVVLLNVRRTTSLLYTELLSLSLRSSIPGEIYFFLTSKGDVREMPRIPRELLEGIRTDNDRSKSIADYSLSCVRTRTRDTCGVSTER